MRNRRIANRRDFLTKCLAGVVAATATGSALPAGVEYPTEKTHGSKVVIARDGLLRGAAGTVNSDRILRLLDRAMQSLCGTEITTQSWSRFVHPGQRVAVKVNTLGGRALSSNVQLVEAICERLQDSGVRAREITVFDRDSAELERAGARTRNVRRRVPRRCRSIN